MRNVLHRIIVLMAITAALLLLMAFQLYRLTVPESAAWQEQGRQQRIRELPSYGTRGAIYDAKGRPLATSEPAYAAVLIGQDPEAIEKMMPKLALVLADGDYGLAEEIRSRVMARVWAQEEDGNQFEPLPIQRALTPKAVASFMERRGEFPDVILVEEATRHYPQGALSGALLGYVGAISDAEISLPEFEEYGPNELVGKAGLELAYEHFLRGTPGQSKVQIDPLGRRVGGFEETPPQPGNNIYLTLNMDLQRLAEDALVKQMEWIKLQGNKEANPTIGSVVMQDVRTGAILAMASYPTYDPNMLVRGTERDWEHVLSQEGIMFNWAITGLSPGSTYKMATGYVGLEAGTVNRWDQIDCPAQYWRYDKPKNWKPYDQGPTNLMRALATSCNPYFWEVAYNTGIEKMHQFYDLLGFGRKTGVDLPDEDPGNNPTIESYGDRWAPGQILNVAIGQGDVLVTPLQLANYTGAIATGGIRYQPYLVEEIRSAAGEVVMKREPAAYPQIPAKEETWAALQTGMRDAVTSPEGTAWLPMLDFPIPTAAKTGSAQTGGQYSDATTVIYAPYKNPEVAISVVIKGGATGSWATPIARRLLAAYFGINDVMPKDAPTYRDPVPAGTSAAQP
ncbi:MAG TPA: penicillin-binding protein 2 [Symbiobacteriaceae bacterium]|nr:penicillin-binding protein 2 [Symbiobacteriaceae bacterium]